ncbi:hypothetical protein AF435_14785, partial [Listeria monocytogenes]|nr:hypothetical protein [Listeria monocytogenes]
MNYFEEGERRYIVKISEGSSLDIQYYELKNIMDENYFYYLENDKLKKYVCDESGNAKFEVLNQFMGDQSSALLSQFLKGTNTVYEYLLETTGKNFNGLIEYMLHFAEVNYADVKLGGLIYFVHSEGMFVRTKNIESQKIKFEKVYCEYKELFSKIYFSSISKKCSYKELLISEIQSIKKMIRLPFGTKNISFVNLDQNFLSKDKSF